MMEGILFPETSVLTRTTPYNIPEDDILRGTLSLVRIEELLERKI
jgi:hypothetical protein